MDANGRIIREEEEEASEEEEGHHDMTRQEFVALARVVFGYYLGPNWEEESLAMARYVEKSR